MRRDVLVNFLSAELEAKTDQQQTAIHYAVRGDAVESLRLLIERGGVRVVDSAKYCYLIVAR